MTGAGVCARTRTGAAARLACACVVLALASAAARAQDYGDTPYVRTPQNVVEQMLRLGRVGAKDYVIDLGSGDGRIVITAAKQFGARGFGVDLDPRLVDLANRNAAREGVADRAAFYARDLYETDISKATVVTFYLLPEVNMMLRPRLLKLLKPGTRLVAHDYDLGDWKPDRSMIVPAPDKPVGRDKISKVYFWVVPAQVAGRWRAHVALPAGAQDYEFTLAQSFQVIEGSATVDGHNAKLTDSRLVGDRISLTLETDAGGTPVRHDLRGRVNGGVIEGVMRITGGGAPIQQRFSAQRSSADEAHGDAGAAAK